MLTFDRELHAYYWNGVHVPNVTTLLKPISGDLSNIPPHVLALARDRGVAVHKAIELYETDNLDFSTLHHEVLPYLAQWQRFMEESGYEVLETESRVYHPLFQYAGTLDLRMRIDGRPAIVDIKATWSLPKTAGPQTAAYDLAYVAQYGGPSHDRYALHLKKDGWRLEPLTNNKDAGVFLSCLTIWRFNNG